MPVIVAVVCAHKCLRKTSRGYPSIKDVLFYVYEY